MAHLSLPYCLSIFAAYRCESARIHVHAATSFVTLETFRVKLRFVHVFR